jgi:arsenite methyltransferase
MIPRFVAQQLSHPKGIMRGLISFLMNRHNARMNSFTLRELRLQATDHVLEVGFGGGPTLPFLLSATAYVAAIDRSADIIAWANRRFCKEIEAGKAHFRQAQVEALPFRAAEFDKVCTVNTVYFWKSLQSGCSEIYRVLTGGRAAIGFLPKETMDRMRMPRDIFTTRSPAELIAAMTESGFTDVLVSRPEPSTLWNVAMGTRAWAS